MDVVAGLLDGPRARGAFLLRSHLTAPWGMRIEDESPLTIVPVLRGRVWLAPSERNPSGDDGGARVPPSDTGADGGTWVEAGDVVLLRGPEHYVVADSPATEPTVVVGPNPQDCRAIDGGPSEMITFGVRSWGNDPDGETVIITGTYPLDGAVGRRILRLLPHRVVLRRGDIDATVIDLLAREVVQDLPGQEAVLDRLLDLLLITCLRTWLDRPDAPGWYRADADPAVGAALRLIHHDPARPWSVESLAREVGLSRAAFARRFTELVGEPPVAYLTGWRLDLAADLLLADDGATLAAVARTVGYTTPFALSAAFKRVRGISPAEHRRRAA
ncbi:AraC family transcriptional regulator [Isoptericola chiayiensis]|uniref:AraC family transcriptional regulator n=1 Tax=Isoptericola chiayiensis TaxID=579446 RepID=A0ABP8Y6K2_9MICO|nr:AraC family transcriptional regulator [Isoptericola chiayiensis]NOW02397.1 AraC-like DNA-binding protein [Isoptericola chiayiensis]